MGQIQVWDESLTVIDTIHLSCGKALSQTINNDVAVDATGGLTTIPITGHGYLANSYIYITGSVAYNGLKYITAVGTNSITIRSTFVAETFAGSETTRFVYTCPVAYKLLEVRWHRSASSADAENLSIILDSGLGSAYDAVLLAQATANITDYNFTPTSNYYFAANDLLVFTYANSGSKTVGLEVKVRRMTKPGAKG